MDNKRRRKGQISININNVNNISSVNQNENENKNKNKNENKSTNVNIGYGWYKFSSWFFGLIIFLFLGYYAVVSITDWINQPPPYTYRNFRGQNNVIKEFHLDSDITLGQGGWIISDIFQIEERVFGLYVPGLKIKNPDTLIFGTPSEIYAILDDSFLLPKRIQKFYDKYILIASKSEHRTVVSFRNKYSNHYDRHNELEKNGAQYRLSFSVPKIGPAYVYSLNNCYRYSFDRMALSDFIKNKNESEKYTNNYVTAYCPGDYGPCSIIKSSTRCGVNFKFNYFRWKENKDGITMDDFFTHIEKIDNEASSALTIVNDKNIILSRELKHD